MLLVVGKLDEILRHPDLYVASNRRHWALPNTARKAADGRIVFVQQAGSEGTKPAGGLDSQDSHGHAGMRYEDCEPEELTMFVHDRKLTVFTKRRRHGEIELDYLSNLK